MNKEEAKHLSDVLKAYSEGKTIQVRFFHVKPPCGWTEWEDADLNKYAFSSMNDTEWRVKPEPKYRPYKNAEEFLKAQKEHGPYVNTKSFSSLGIYTIPYSVEDLRVYWKAGYGVYSNWEQLSHCKWQDGTPCGILE